MRLSFIRLDAARILRSAKEVGSVALLAAVVGCGGADTHAPAVADDGFPAPAMKPIAPPSGRGNSNSVSITETTSPGPRGLLELTAVGALDQSLGTLEFEVRSHAGRVLSKGFNDVQGADSERHLLLELPAGDGYEVSLDSSAEGGSKCHASIGSLSVPADATASYQAFIWQCDGAPATEHECYWLADWVGASRARAAVGQGIDLGISANDEPGTPAQVTWIDPGAKLGSFSHRHGARTTFTCQAAADSVPLEAIVAGNSCSRRLKLSVSCF